MEGSEELKGDWPTYKILTQAPIFDKYFPSLISNMYKIGEEINFDAPTELEYHQSRDNFRLKYIDPIFKDILPEWEELITQEDGYVNNHIIMVTYLFLKDQEIAKLPEKDQNMLSWIGILHDIEKIFGPDRNKDPMHPFNSAATTLHILARLLNLTKYPKFMEELDSLSKLFRKSTKKLYKRWYNPYKKSVKSEIYERCIDLNGCCKIFENLEKLFPKDCFCYNIILLIALHQSLPAIPKYPCFDELNEDQIVLYFTPYTIKLMYLIMINDSLSYSQHIDLRGEIQCNVPQFMFTYNRILKLF